ncbi:MAG: GNAT family N-acetyltransferase [Oscillospiraceae bacterium]|nr:GNAT family N-acetyltransferase [Oscillospiraceae bacterium]
MYRTDDVRFAHYADMIRCGAVYPMSMAQGIQGGDMYTDGEAVLFHHDCGFGLLAGDMSIAFLDDVYELMKNCGRRLVLFSERSDVTERFASRADIRTDLRYFYEYKGSDDIPVTAPKRGFTVERIDAGNIDRLNGRIVPSFSWKRDVFLKNGFGFAVMCGGKAASWAFSAAVSDTETDIGVETAEEFRGQGLASAAVSAMTAYILRTGRKPVWACHHLNTASARLAEKNGFVKVAECMTITREGTT